ncbi:tachykinin-like peptides receptor 86C isoform X2 [Aedes albopictus]|uniref:G-protein coupled receptors family 1 profile domain-containing protein n=1 Tax=Aedes albopictus TaxID=7160 RepID=A0ABM1ZRP8_AEDAL
MYSTVMTKRYHNGKTRTVCYMLWPDGRYPTSMADYIYNLVFLILTYGIPMLIMIVCYSLMGRELWGSRSIGEHTERQLESMKSKKKVVRMFIIVVTIFGICWLPYHLFFVYAYHNNQMTSSSYVQQLYLGFYWLAMSNAMVNPIIYYWMNSRFRIYFQDIICFCCLQFLNARMKDGMPQGVLLHKNSNSEPGRYRSCKSTTFAVGTVATAVPQHRRVPDAASSSHRGPQPPAPPTPEHPAGYGQRGERRRECQREAGVDAGRSPSDDGHQRASDGRELPPAEVLGFAGLPLAESAERAATAAAFLQ